MKKSPCKDCKDRYVGCHSQCSAFAEYRTIHNEESTKKYKYMMDLYGKAHKASSKYPGKVLTNKKVYSSNAYEFIE